MPEAWVRAYNEGGLMVQDPALRWVYAETGAVRLSALALPDPAGLYTLAATLGMHFGAVLSIKGGDDARLRSFAMLFRGDRELADAELAAALAELTALHRGSALPQLTGAEVEALRLQARGLKMKQIAAICGISESAVKARLVAARRRLGARTASELLSIASSRRLI